MRLGLWTHLPIEEDCPSATLQNRVPTSGCAYRVQIINLPPHKTRAFGRDLLLQRKSQKHCRTYMLYGSIAVLVTKHISSRLPLTVGCLQMMTAIYDCLRYICPLSVTHSLVSRMFFCSATICHCFCEHFNSSFVYIKITPAI